jgi:hypothetical protein
MRCGTCREGDTLKDMRRCVEKCRRVIEMGSIIRPDKDICDYELLFVHINTIRKRIDRIMEDPAFEGLDWNNNVERVKTILLLQFLEVGE